MMTVFKVVDAFVRMLLIVMSIILPFVTINALIYSGWPTTTKYWMVCIIGLIAFPVVMWMTRGAKSKS